MDLVNILSRIRDEYTRRKNGENKDRVDDSFIDAIGPEISGFFLRLFKEGEDDTIFGALNAFALSLYQFSPGTLQFFFRFITNVRLERLQGRLPRAVSLPLLVFIKGYMNALEDATREKPRATAGDIKAAAEKVTERARDASSELGKRFNAAKQAAKRFKDSSHTNQEGPMANPNPKPPPSAGGAGGGSPPPPKNPNPPPKKDGNDNKKKGFSELVDTAKDILAAFSAIVAWWGDRGEDRVQEVARALFWVPVALLATAAFTFIAAISPRDEPMMVVTVVASIFWTLGPFCAYYLWRERNARLSKGGPSEENPAEQPGNGVIELGALGGAAAVTILGSSIVVAALCAIAAYTHFDPTYVWVGLLSISLTYVGWTMTDVGLDSLRAVGQLLSLQGETFKKRARGVRAFTLAGMIYMLVMAYPVFLYLFVHTDYRGSEAILGIFLPLTGGIAVTRMGSPSDGPPAPAHAEEILAQFAKRNLRFALSFLTGGVVVTALFVVLDHGLLPPTCPDGAEIAPHECDSELPSYARRLADLRGSAEDAIKPKAEAPAATPTESPADPCDASQVFVKGLQKEDCEVILGAKSADPELKDECRQAQRCGLLDKRGRKP